MNKPTIRTPAIFSQFPEITAGVTMHSAPLSPGNQFNETNYGTGLLANHYAGDELATQTNAVQAARHALATDLIGPGAVATFVGQVHGATVVEATPGGDANSTVEADGIFTGSANHLLGVVLADCGGVLFYDPDTKLIAAVHSGWRGTKDRIVPTAIAALTARGVVASRLQVYLSPTPCASHYEVGPEFNDYFESKFIFKDGERHYFNNAAAIQAQLEEAGISHIEIDPTCSIEDTHFHSHRRDQPTAGRFVAFIGRRA